MELICYYFGRLIVFLFFLPSESPNLDSSSVSFDEIMVSLATVCPPNMTYLSIQVVFYWDQPFQLRPVCVDTVDVSQ